MSASLTKELEDVRNLKQITKVQFGVLSPAEILKGSVCEITSPVTYEGTEPKINGLFDPRMGVIERGRLCSTCENNSDLCPGHFGHTSFKMCMFSLFKVISG
jgi:DNA-directed RNA polymerase II subunit RPB1